MNDVTKDLLDALREIVAEAQDFERRTGQRVQGWPDKARAAIARAEAALASPQPDALEHARRVVIPSHEESKAAVEDGSATALHAFIYDNEPADLELEKVFRETLKAVLDDAVGGVKP